MPIHSRWSIEPHPWKLDIWSWWASNRLGRVPRILIIRWNIVFVWYLRYQAEDWETCFKTLSGKSLGPTSSPVSMHRSVVFIKTRSGRWLLGLNFERFSSSHDKTVTKTYQNTESTETAYACCGIFVCGKCNQPNLEAKLLFTFDPVIWRLKYYFFISVQNVFLSVTDKQNTHSLGINLTEETGVNM